MADNVAITAGAGTSIATDDVSSVHYQIIKVTIGALDAAGSLLVGGAGAVAAGVLRTTLASDDPAVASLSVLDDWDSTDACKTVSPMVTVSTDVTRAANTTTYTINDNVGSTSAGGYTFTSAARASGGSGIITDMIVSFEEDAATPLQGEIRIYDSSFTAVADNAALVFSDAESKTFVAAIPFSLSDSGNQGTAHVQNLSIGFTTVGSADLRFAVRALNGYVPTTNSSVLTVRLKILQVT